MALINGTLGNDTLAGAAEDEIINRLGGFDSLVGGNGNDSVAGNNDDVLTGGSITFVGIQATALTAADFVIV